MEKTIQHVLMMISEGVDILDVGGESTRPNAIPVFEQELQREIPVIHTLCSQTLVFLLNFRRN